MACRRARTARTARAAAAIAPPDRPAARRDARRAGERVGLALGGDVHRRDRSSATPRSPARWWPRALWPSAIVSSQIGVDQQLRRDCGRRSRGDGRLPRRDRVGIARLHRAGGAEQELGMAARPGAFCCSARWNCAAAEASPIESSATAVSAVRMPPPAAGTGSSTRRSAGFAVFAIASARVSAGDGDAGVSASTTGASTAGSRTTSRLNGRPSGGRFGEQRCRCPDRR